MDRWPLGIFTSIGGGLGAGLDAVRRLGVKTVQLHAPDGSWRSAERCRDTRRQFADSGITVTVVFVGFPDDDYTTIDSVQRTVGLVPAASRPDRLAETLAIAGYARELGVDAIGMHLGFVPTRHDDPERAAVIAATRQVCDHCRTLGQRFHLETGQESADELRAFITEVDRDNLAVNFDPANMILYGAGEPLAALDVVGPWVHSVHCKDAARQRQPGQPWYADAPLGTGDVNVAAFLARLQRLGYYGPLTVEREYSPDQAGDLEAALRLLGDLRDRLLGAL